MSETSEMVFAAFMQHFAEYRYHVRDVEDTLYTVAPRPARREGSL